MSTPLGLILTHAPSLTALRQATAMMRADALKVTGWGLPGGWASATIAEAAALTRVFLYRTVRGDPSVAGGIYGYPHLRQTLDEIAPFARVRPTLVIELGNEPEYRPFPLDPESYVQLTLETIAACRSEAMFPRATILPPAFSLNSPGSSLHHWLHLMRPVFAACDGWSLHAYSAEQLRLGMQLAAEYAPGKPIWLTEFGLPEALDPDERARRYWSMLRDQPLAAAFLYHLDQNDSPALPQQGSAHFRLQPRTLTMLGQRSEFVMDHWPNARVAGFAMDIRRWPTVADFRAHLALYRFQSTAAWARGCTVHHTFRPLAAQWEGWKSVLALARFYRTKKSPPWSAGPHLFICPDAPKVEDRGIWQMTPLNQPGIHAIGANDHYWGVEHVGDFTSRPMPPDTAAMGAGAVAALLDWARLPVSPATVPPHSAFNKPECPGAAVDMDAYRRAVAALRSG